MRPLNSDRQVPFSQENTDEPDEYSEGSGSLKVRKNKDIKRTHGDYNVFCGRHNRIMKPFEVNEKKTDACRLPAGYFASVTHRLNFSPMEAFHYYKLRDEQAKYFEQMKVRMAAMADG